MEIVRTDTLFGSKKNIVGSTTADLVLETLGKVYIKTGKSTKTLTEILSEYSKEGNNRKSSEINTEEVSKLLSSEYMENLIIQVLNKKKIFGEFVTVDTVRSKGNYNLPIYFDSKAEAQTILGLSIQNKIETQDIVLGQKGVSAGGVCDLTISGGYGGGGISEEVLQSFWNDKEQWIQDQIIEQCKLLQQALNVDNSDLTKTVSNISQNIYGVISVTFADIPNAGDGQRGLITANAQSIYGVKTFQNNIIANNGITLNKDYYLCSYKSGINTLNLIGYNSTSQTIKLGSAAYSVDVLSSLIMPNNSSLAFYASNSYSGYRGSTSITNSEPIRVVAMGDNNIFLLGSYWNQSGIKTRIYGEDISFYLTVVSNNSSSSSIAGTINQTGLHMEQGISCEGICDLTLDSASARIQALEDRIYALEHPNE